MEKKIQLELSQEQTNKILFALSKEPYIEVYELINEIRKQATPQVAE